MVGCLFSSVFGQRAEDQETVEIVGERGRINLERHNGSLGLISAFGQGTAHFDGRGSEFKPSHFGADLRLIRTLSRFCTEGAAAPAGFDDAYIASTTALAAQRTIKTGVPESPATAAIASG